MDALGRMLDDLGSLNRDGPDGMSGELLDRHVKQPATFSENFVKGAQDPADPMSLLNVRKAFLDFQASHNSLLNEIFFDKIRLAAQGSPAEKEKAVKRPKGGGSRKERPWTASRRAAWQGRAGRPAQDPCPRKDGKRPREPARHRDAGVNISVRAPLTGYSRFAPPRPAPSWLDIFRLSAMPAMRLQAPQQTDSRLKPANARFGSSGPSAGPAAASFSGGLT
jgi:hypothetical protein